MSLRKFKRGKKRRVKVAKKADAVSFFVLGNQEFNRGNLAGAVTAYGKALELRPDYVEAMDNLAVVLHEQGESEASVALLRRSVAINPDNPVALNNLAASLRSLGLFDEAREKCLKALDLAPDFVDAHNNLGTILMAMGEKTGSEASFRKAVELDRRNASAWRHLVLCRRYPSIDDPDMTAISAAIEKADPGSVDEMFLRFAAGKICDDCAAYDQAFSFFSRANEIRRSFVRYNRDDYRRMVDRITEIFSPALFTDYGEAWNGAVQSELPVFIVGMPRSGSSLVEQVLASHPEVAGVGENKQVNRLVQRLSDRCAGRPYPDCVPDAAPDVLTGLGIEYLDWLKETAGGSTTKRVTDKTLTNHLHVGLLWLLFPKARFIHCNRDPLDIAVSLFSLYMPEVIYGGSLEDIAMVYREERRLMDHWVALDKEINDEPRIMQISYEAMVEDIEGESRRMLEFLGLAWDDSCLDFHTSRRPVSSASAWQVRRPVYKTSVGRWKNYKKHLGPLRKIIEIEG